MEPGVYLLGVLIVAVATVIGAIIQAFYRKNEKEKEDVSPK